MATTAREAAKGDRSGAKRNLKEAELLSSSTQTMQITKSIELYKRLCDSSDSNNNVDMLFDVIVSFVKHIKSEAYEMITKWMDIMKFVSQDEYDRIRQVLVKISQSDSFDEHHRSVIAITLYNMAELGICYSCFESIARDKKVTYTYRAEACKYLFASELDDERSVAQECVTEIIFDFSITTEQRYSVIAAFISKSGITSFLNAAKIRIAYNEEFVYGLQMLFFNEIANDIRHRILSGQHILQMSCSTPEEKESVVAILITIAKNTELDENTRADAADVILRLGGKKAMDEARVIITDMGFSAVKSDNKNVLSRVKTVYNNSQNVHNEGISSSSDAFIEKLLDRDFGSPLGSIESRTVPGSGPSYEKAEKEIGDLARSLISDATQKHAIYKALNRIKIDTATFTTRRATMADILAAVWMKITEQKDRRPQYEQRLLEEMVEMGSMGGTCSTGHSYRFVNTLNGIDGLHVTINFADQIKGNVAGRIAAYIRDIGDDDLRSSISAGMLSVATDEDKHIYSEFIGDTIADIKTELYNEFVNDGYITKEEFDLYFKDAVRDWEPK